MSPALSISSKASKLCVQEIEWFDLSRSFWGKENFLSPSLFESFFSFPFHVVVMEFRKSLHMLYAGVLSSPQDSLERIKEEDINFPHFLVY
jgi:hypothetical protein